MQVSWKFSTNDIPLAKPIQNIETYQYEEINLLFLIIKKSLIETRAYKGKVSINSIENELHYWREIK